MALWILLSLACTASDADTEPAAVSDTDTGEPMVEPAWSESEVQDAMDSLLSVGLPSADEWMTAYFDYMSHGDETCPGDANQLRDTLVPPEGCTSEEGWFYQGISTLVEVDDEIGAGYVFTADMTLSDPDGSELRGGGSVNMWDGGKGSISMFSGTFVGESEEGWLRDGLSAAQFVVNRAPDGGVVLQGALSLGGVGVIYEDVIYMPECLGLMGQIHLRGDVDQRWYVLDFGEVCAPCGRITFRDQELGEVCIGEHPTLVGVGSTDTGR